MFVLGIGSNFSAVRSDEPFSLMWEAPWTVKWFLETTAAIGSFLFSL